MSDFTLDLHLLPLLRIVLQHFLDYPAATGHNFSKRGLISPKVGTQKLHF